MGGLQGGISAWSFGAGPTASSAAPHPRQGLCSGWAVQEQQVGLANERLHVRSPFGKFLELSCLARKLIYRCCF